MTIAPPRPKMPSLNSLRAFEAVSRNSSIAAAANELCVTPAAIAQHIKLLEIWANAKLLNRGAKGITLTPLGANVLDEFSLAFDQLGVAVHKLRTSATPLEIRIAALPCVAQLWLSPRLPRIRQKMPELSISVNALEREPNLLREPYDLAIFYRADCDGEHCIMINQDTIFPVCSPFLAEGLSQPVKLSGETFLHDSSWNDDWAIWSSQALSGVNFNKSGPEFSLYSLALEECQNGAGILIGHEDLVRMRIQNGDLVELFEQKIRLPRYLTMNTQIDLSTNSIVKKIVEMLLEDY